MNRKFVFIVFAGIGSPPMENFCKAVDHILRDGEREYESHYQFQYLSNVTLSLIKSSKYTIEQINKKLVESGIMGQTSLLAFDITTENPCDIQSHEYIVNMPAQYVYAIQAFQMNCVEKWATGTFNLADAIRNGEDFNPPPNIEECNLSLDELLELMKKRGGGYDVLSDEEKERLAFLRSQM